MCDRPWSWYFFFFFSSRRRHTRYWRDWSSDVCSSDLSALGVIDESVLELGPGFTAITGETGAGKTMVVTALGLLLGGRADSGAVRTGAKQARVEGLVRAAASLATAV